MKEFLMKTITEVSDEYDFIQATRMRNSNGYASIKLTYGKSPAKVQTIEIEDEDGHYEQHAIELARVLEAVAMDRCQLPNTSSEDQ